MKAKSKKSPKSRAVRDLVMHKAYGSRVYRLKASEFKRNVAIERLSAEFHAAFPSRDDVAYIHADPFPKTYSELFSKPAIPTPAHIVRELIWACSACTKFANEIRVLRDRQQELELAVLQLDRAAAEAALDRAEAQLGVSIWLFQNRVAVAQQFEGSEARLALLKHVEDGLAADRSLTRALLRLISKRADSSGSRQLKGDIERLFEDEPNPILESYLRTKLVKFFNPLSTDAVGALLLEAQTSLVDYYETLLACLRSATGESGMSQEVAKVLLPAVKLLQRRTGDPRIVPIVRAMGGQSLVDESQPSIRANLIEAYSTGDFASLTSRATAYLRQYPYDLLVWLLLNKAVASSGRSFEQTGTLLDSTRDDLQSLLRLDEGTYGAALSLFSLCDRFAGQAWSLHLTGIVLHELREEVATYPPASLRRVVALDRFDSPYVALAAPASNRAELLASPLFKTAYASTLESVRAALGEANVDEIRAPALRRLLVKARACLVRGEFDAAIATIATLLELDDLPRSERLRAHAALAAIEVKSGNVECAVKAAVDGILLQPDVPTIYPIADIVAELQDARAWPSTIDVPLIFELYTTFFGDDRWAHLRYAFERFQQSNKISSPDDLVERCAVLGEPRVRRYLGQVWRPEVMRQTTIYNDLKEIEQTRIDVCRELIALDPEDSGGFGDELRERVKRQEIARGATLVEQSKVYVDVVAIKRALRAKLGGAYSQYKSTSHALPSTSDEIKALYELASSLSSSEQKPLSEVLSMIELMDFSASDADVQFGAIYSDIVNEFVNGDHGLNAYLSTRVRHGKMSNALRRPSASAQLVTATSEGGKDYLRHDYWLEQLSELDVLDRQSIERALVAFATSLDAVINDAVKRLIQVRIIRNVKEHASGEAEAFIYWSSNLERKYLQDFDRNVTSLDELIDRCVEVLWEKTDRNLDVLQQRLNVDVRAKIAACFDDLGAQLDALTSDRGIGALRNAIAGARTETQAALSQVIKWFKRSEVYDRQDYSLDFPVQVALNIIRRTVAGALDWEGIDVKTSDDALMPGRTLDGMVDIIDGLLSNAIQRSGLPLSELKVWMKLVLKDGGLTLSVRNEVHADRRSPPIRERVDRIRETLDRADSRHKAQLEGNSGFHKIWRTLNSPFYCDPMLDFGFVDSGFVATVQCRLERIDAENPIN